MRRATYTRDPSPAALRCLLQEEHHMKNEITIGLSPDEANAVVNAVCVAIADEGETLSGLAFPDCPGAFSRVGQHARRIAGLQSVASSLLWRAHWGELGGSPDPVTAPEAVWLDLAAELRKRAEDQLLDEAGDQEKWEYGPASRTVAGAYAGAAEMAVV